MRGHEKQRILIVDDESVIADTLVIIFNKEGYEARGAYSAEEALALLAGWTPQLAFVDVRLPGMNGIDLALRMRAAFPECRISLFAGQASTSDLKTSAMEGGEAFDILEKPIHPATLLRVASQLLEAP